MNYGRMLWAVIVQSFRAYVRDRMALFWGLVFPLIFIFMFGLAFNNQSININVSVVDSGNPQLAQALTTGLKQIQGVHLHQDSQSKALSSLKSGDLDMVVIVPSGQPPLKLQVYTDQSNQQVAQVGISIVKSLIQQVNQGMTGASQPVTMVTKSIEGPNQSYLDFLVPGIIAMTLMQAGMLGITQAVTELRERQILKRLLTTAAPPWVFIGGILTRFTFTNLVQVAIIYAVSMIVFGVQLPVHWLGMVGAVVLGSLVFTAIGMMISTVSSSPEAANQLASLSSFPMMFLSGVFFPKALMPPFMRGLVNWLPLTPLVDTLRDIVVRGASVAGHGLGLGYLALWGLVAAAIASWRFRWE